MPRSFGTGPRARGSFLLAQLVFVASDLGGVECDSRSREHGSFQVCLVQTPDHTMNSTVTLQQTQALGAGEPEVLLPLCAPSNLEEAIAFCGQCREGFWVFSGATMD